MCVVINHEGSTPEVIRCQDNAEVVRVMKALIIRHEEQSNKYLPIESTAIGIFSDGSMWHEGRTQVFAEPSVYVPIPLATEAI